MLVSSKKHVEPLEVWPAIEVGSLGNQDLLDGLGVIDHDAFGGPQRDAKNVAVFLLKMEYIAKFPHLEELNISTMKYFSLR